LPDFGWYGPSTYGDRIAGVFDESFVPHDEHSAAGFLASVAGGGPALELGIGTGRVATSRRASVKMPPRPTVSIGPSCSSE